MSSISDSSDVLLVSDPIATVLCCKKKFWLHIGEVNTLHINGRSVDFVSFDMLIEDTVSVLYQMSCLCTSTMDDDPDQQNDWRTCAIDECSFTNNYHTWSTSSSNKPFHFENAHKLSVLSIPEHRSCGVNYCTYQGIPISRGLCTCFVCEANQDLGEIGEQGTLDCPQCSPTIILNLSQGQRVLEHIGVHILYDPAVLQSMSLCGLCLRPAPLCQFFLAKGKGANGNIRIDQKASRGCLMKLNFSYGIAAVSTSSLPCSNVPIHCELCLKVDPAIWRYFMKAHFQEKHPNTPFTKYEHIWTLSKFERSEMKKIWGKRTKVTIKRAKKLTLQISENHHTQIPLSPATTAIHLYSID
ncbi:uncharacterized protein LACBIDRAFT_305052 [Laccaria bicolor S238N-H82]|uniref:Predicted protein n=1 Tax=Laccaria bicolor (strain S238N-H82 / ATCC MYA-4686) TaxID=486041 RepID=B0CTB6_LACBS|nr:uncharacterized protein LACBIDRAFT_305052 [Laccaria bicolor S238N-H82]EDR14469.1 predicted protein [Laccaria bicolor S238N-H82]|eukprot:XP_001875028.1 predicted protein [Laccaria bicolor S238N-H82]